MLDLVIRPHPPKVSTSKNPFIVYTPPWVVLQYGFTNDQVTNIETPSGAVKAVKLTENRHLREKVLQMSQLAQRLYDLKLGDHVKLSTQSAGTHLARCVVLTELGGDGKYDIDIPRWSEILRIKVLKLEMVSPGLVLDKIHDPQGVDKEERSFTISQMDGSASVGALELHPEMKVKLSEAGQRVKLIVPDDGIGGLQGTLKVVNRYVSHFNDEPPYVKLRRRQGVLLHGCAGTGKSLLLDSVLKGAWGTKIVLNPSTTKSMIQQAFEDAANFQPAVIAIHDVAAIAENVSRRPRDSLAYALMDGFKNIQGQRVLVVAACRALSDIDQDLRKRHFFATEIEIPPPDTAARAAILKIHRGIDSESEESVLDSIAQQTHGCVGEDLVHLLDFAEDEAEERLENGRDGAISSGIEEGTESRLMPIESDYLRALRRIRPTALKEIFIETPTVRWDDIAGQKEVKKYLEKAIIWPRKYAQELAENGLQTSNGLLLYGPPGCSKTMIAKAAATESKLNFVAVKGAELLNMYVGETERAIRNLFAKARAASPCIVFFDEMEAVATARDKGVNGGVHTVTTLLNELDGINSTRGVFVLGATNQPELIDSALLRPGRLDSSIYIEPPDDDAREQILQAQTSKMRLGDVDLHKVALNAAGMSGADVVRLCQEAGSLMFEEKIRMGDAQLIRMEHFDKALETTKVTITQAVLDRYKAFNERSSSQK